MNTGQQTAETLDAFKEALGSPDNSLKKTWTQNATSTQGLQIYNLEAPSKKLFPVLTPLRNRLARVAKPGGNALNWKAVTAINSGSVPLGVSEGNRNGVLSTTTQEFTAPFRGIGYEDSVSYEAEYAGQGFEDIRALAAENLLKAVMIGEEGAILFGNGSDGIALGTTPTPTGTVIATPTGAAGITAGTYKLRCVALTHRAWRRSVVSSVGVPSTLSRTSAGAYANTDTVNLGAAAISAESADLTTSGGNLGISGKVAAVAGAVAYAWYLGTTGATKIVAITTTNTVTLGALPAGGNQAAGSAPASDYSQDSLIFTGMFSSIMASGSGAYSTSLDGATFTADQAGGIKEIETMLQNLFDNKRLQPDLFLVSSQGAKDMIAGVLRGGSAPPAFRLEVSSSGTQAAMQGGVILASYLGKFGQASGDSGGAAIPIMVHPEMPPGVMLAISFSLPYPVNGVPTCWQIATRQDYYAVEWPRIARKYEYGVYADELLQSYAPFAHGCIYNIGAGIS